MDMNITNYTSLFDNNSLSLSSALNPCPRQRNITRPLLFVHNYALLFFGSIFNFLAFAILMQRSLRCHSTFAYLAFLSLSNGLLSLVHFSKWMFNYYFNLVLENFLLTCRFHRFSSDFLTHFSLFTLICVNIDRARTVTKNCPKRKYPKSKFRIVLIKEFFIGSILCAFHFHWIIKYGYEVFDSKSKSAHCGFNENQTTTIYYYLLTRIYPPFELVVFFCLPLFINIFCTILIVRSLRVRMRTAKQFHQSKTIKKDEEKLLSKSEKFLSYFLPQTTNKKSNLHNCFCFQMQCRQHTRMRLKMGRSNRSLNKYEEENHVIDRKKSILLLNNNQNQVTSNLLIKKHRTRRTRDIHLSAMLISLNILYLILNLPFNFHQTFVTYFHNATSSQCEIMFTSLLLDALQQTFFSTNFFLYVLTNRRFREEFYNTITKILSHCKQQNSPRENSNNQSYKSQQARASSCNPSTTITPTNQIFQVLPTDYCDSIISDIEFTETLPIQHPQPLESIDEN
ncbi:unnamed protein product [Adineta steineri]|uniref:G-protein coupled receptors family 1 profile domain-containing protein n=1 Tax=Adineta steineri TaxID=433720 RepID=A0A814XFL3_9BILA|nr:unnamed protein product [Adineta steineri]CAF1215075.1 unnamed protein product [Adineta steineri]